MSNIVSLDYEVSCKFYFKCQFRDNTQKKKTRPVKSYLRQTQNASRFGDLLVR